MMQDFSLKESSHSKSLRPCRLKLVISPIPCNVVSFTIKIVPPPFRFDDNKNKQQLFIFYNSFKNIETRAREI